MTSVTLILELQSYWQIGSGDGLGAIADSAALRDANGLPYIPGRQIKGILRQAFREAHIFQAYADCAETELESLLFGTGNQTDDRFATLPGLLHISNAVLAADEQAALLAQPGYISHLFQMVYSTAIDNYGVAKDGSLRGSEVAIPMRLSAHIGWEVTSVEPAYRARQQQLMSAYPLATLIAPLAGLVAGVGAKRNRGFGEVICSMEGAH